MYCNGKKTYRNVALICTVLFSLKRCFYLGECVIKALKLTCIAYCPLTGGYFRPCGPQIRVRDVRLLEVINVVFERRNRRDRGLVSAYGKCPLTRGVR